MAAQFADLGVVVEVDRNEDGDESGVTLVWDSNWPAVTAFLGVATQWRVVARGMAGVLQWLGLDYAAVDVALRRLGAPDAVFADLQVMEAAALETFGEMAEAGEP